MTTNSQIILYKTQTGEIKIDVHLEFVKFASQNDFFIKKLKTFTPPVLITMPKVIKPVTFLK